jgi:nucleoid-associated protein YgaU
MAAWMKIAAVLAGLFGLAAVVTVYGLPPRPAQTPAPSSTSSAPAAEVAKSDAAKPDAAKSDASKSDAAKSDPSKPDAVKSDAASTDAAKGVKPAEGGVAATAPAQDPVQVARIDPQASTPGAPGGSAGQASSRPTFDIVRVLPSGEVVVAGRTSPNASVELLRNGVLHHKATADASGHFAMVPPNLPAGTHDLTLVATTPDGRREVSSQSVAVSVPADAGGSVVVALASPDKPTQILSSLPSAASAQPDKSAPPLAPGQRPGVVLGSVEVEESGRFFATGRSAPGAIVRLYMNDTFLAAATASPEGTWSFAINRGVEPGSYRIRIDDIDAKGTVLSRAEVPFDFAPRVAVRPGSSKSTAVAVGPVLAPEKAPTTPAGPQLASADATAPGGANVVVDEIRTTTVSRGDSLWRISKRVYGKGLRYTVIYEANQRQIRDPGLIYPGQLFVVPGERVN